MAHHGYLQDWDEDLDSNDRDRRERDERDWRNRERGLMFGDPNRRAWEDNRDWPQRERGFDAGPENRRFSSNTDDHYRSWRDRQMQALDRDYADYCREREQAFHRDFDAWRDRRHGTPQPLQPGMTQSGLSADPTGELQLSTEDQSPSQPEQDPTAAATLGTTSGGRRR